MRVESFEMKWLIVVRPSRLLGGGREIISMLELLVQYGG